ncbi:hypothetical protein OH77DRAFT_988548 [Trametes cingulata]|nr:hypothetical protein OH77DRAFT_988548 [Trametes cingulata]
MHTTIEHHTIQMPPDVPFCENEDELLRFQQATLYDRRNTPDLRDHFVQCTKHLLANPFASLLSGIDEGDGEKVLDIGLRYYTSCSVREVNIDRALYVWEMITNDDHDFVVPKVSNSLLGRTYSCLCLAYFELHEKAATGTPVKKDPTLERNRKPLPLPSNKRDFNLANDYLYVSSIYANGAAELGLVSPAVLSVGMHLRRVAQRDGIDLSKTQRYAPLRHLWRVVDARMREWEEIQAKQAAKVAKAPNAYVCAAPGCGIQGTQKKALLRCAGKCPPHRKPHYCGKECQKKDWKMHKHICKPDSELPSGGSSLGPPISDAPALDADETDNIDIDAAFNEHYEGPGRAIEINVPGGSKLRLQSRNLTPAVMRWMKNQVEKGE